MHILVQVFADTDGSGHMDGWGGGWMWLWGTLMILASVAIIAGAVWLFARGRARASGGGATRARDILEERYARGELTTDEYRDRLDQLR
jgi:putative membrane protein